MLTSAPKNFNPTPLEYHTKLIIEIENITNLGLGIGRHKGWVIMVPNAIVGELVCCRIFRNHSNYSEADLVKILTPSSQRVTPPCPLFGTCGGCQYQHLQYKSQLELKQQHVKELLQKLANVDVEIQPTIGTDQIYYYRSKLTPHFGKDVTNIGFLKMGSRFHIIDVEQCCIATHAINEHFKTLRPKTKAKIFKKGGTLLLRDTGSEVITNPKQIIMQTIGDFKFHVHAGEFFQNNPYILKTFADYIIAEASGNAMTHLIDVYCGVGVFGIYGSQKFETTMGIEINERAIELARQNAQMNAIKNVQFVTGSAENIFTERLPKAQHISMILDPPRKGCDESFLRQLVAFSPKKIIYISCSPDTQARDAKFLLQYGYQIDRVQPFDLFPQTRHIENVITFSMNVIPS